MCYIQFNVYTLAFGTWDTVDNRLHHKDETPLSTLGCSMSAKRRVAYFYDSTATLARLLCCFCVKDGCFVCIPELKSRMHSGVVCFRWGNYGLVGQIPSHWRLA
jgi:hypothetical protein